MHARGKFWWLALVNGVLLIILSFFVFRHPMDALVGVAIYIGITLLFTGLTEIIASIAAKDAIPKWGWGLAGGIIDVLFGFVLLSNPALSAASLPFVVGFWIIVYGVITFVSSFQSKKEGSPYWWLGLVSGVFSVIVGYVITNNLMVGVFTITIWMGIGFLFAGIASISTAFGLRKLSQELT